MLPNGGTRRSSIRSILSHAQRQAQKGFLFGVKGTCVELDFAEPVRLRTDDALVLDDGGLVEIVAEPEPLIEARAADLAGARAARLASRRPACADPGAGAPPAAQARSGDRGAAAKPRRESGRHRRAVRAGGRRLRRARGRSSSPRSSITIITTMVMTTITHDHDHRPRSLARSQARLSAEWSGSRTRSF